MKSGFSGDIFVEDITVENISKRRLIFGNNRNAIQTEYIFTVEKKKKNKKKIMRYKYSSSQYSPWNSEICFDIYKAILSLVYIHQSSLVNPQNHFLIMGLGGGSLCSYLYSYLLNEKEREAQDPYKKVVPLQETTSEEMIKALEENQNSLIQCVEIDETIAKVWFILSLFYTLDCKWIFPIMSNNCFHSWCLWIHESSSGLFPLSVYHSGYW